MKKVVLVIAFVSVALASCKSEKKKDKVEAKKPVEVVKTKTEEVTTHSVDVKTSIVTWKGSKPTEYHNGTISLKSGSLNTKNNELKGGEFIVDMNSIICLDIEDEKSNNGLVGHLKNEDFFNVTKYPTSKFVITSVENKNGKLAVTGNLTVKDITKSITIPATISKVDGITTFKSEKFNVNRTDFGIKYKSKSFINGLKEKFINDLVEFSFHVKTNK